MAGAPSPASSGELASFLASGVYSLVDDEALKVTFLDPVRLLNRSYSRSRVSASSYYSRSFRPQTQSKKRKREGKPRELNAREKAAEQRHQEVRPLLLRAHEALLKAMDLLPVLPEIVRDGELKSFGGNGGEINFVEMGSLWQAPLYEISLCKIAKQCAGRDEHGQETSFQVFNNSIFNEMDDDVEAEFMNNQYILPRKSCFHMSDLRQIHNLISGDANHGFNLIVIDPPWENASANQKYMYPTLPNHYFLSLPIKQLAHSEGALIALWVTNREKLRLFVEKELFPAWGVNNFCACYWLKVKADGSLIGELDLFHHRPYECLLLGYINGKHNDPGSPLPLRQDGQVFISIPGAYSRKPTLEKLLLDYVPGQKPPRGVELFARELQAGWTSWGNEVLCFQDARFFANKSCK